MLIDINDFQLRFNSDQYLLTVYVYLPKVNSGVKLYKSIQFVEMDFIFPII